MFLAAAQLHAQWVPRGNHLSRSNSGIIGPTSSIVADGNGGAYVVWSDVGDIYAQRVSRDGQELWERGGLIVNSGGAYPFVSADGDSGVFIAWEDRDNIRLRKLDMNGRQLWNGSTILSTDILGASGPYLVSDGIGGVICSWSGIDPTGIGYVVPRVQRIDADGKRVWGDSAITLCDRSFYVDIYDVPLVSDGRNGAIVVWLEKEWPPSGDSRKGHTFAQHIDTSGKLLWQKNGVPLTDSTTEQREYLSAVSDGRGGAFALWYCKGYATIQHIDSRGQRHLGKDGLALGQRSTYKKSMASDGAHGIHLVTQASVTPFVRRFQHIDSTDRVQYSVDPAGIDVGGYMFTNLAVSDGHGGVFVAAVTFSGVSDWYVLKVQRYDSAGTALWSPVEGIEICRTVLAPPGYFDLCSTAPGEAMVMWRDSRDTPSAAYGGIYLAKMTSKGVTLPVIPLADASVRTLRLVGPYPNPAQGQSLLECRLTKPSPIQVTLTDLSGRELGLLYEVQQPPDEFFVPIDTSPLAPGSYFIVAKAGEETRTTRLVVARK
jgi:hypothetical protein